MAVDSPIDMETFENAVQQWFTDSMDIQAVWAGNSKTMPEYPVGVLQIISGPITAAPQFEIRESTNIFRPGGTEVELLACVPCTFTVSCQVWAGGDDRWHPSANARFHINRALAGLGNHDQLVLLKAASVSVVRSGPVQNISSVQENAFVSKANMDVTFGAVLNSAAYIGYIERVAAIGTFTGSDITIDREFGDI